jgi:hypothetical protein
MVCDMYVTYSIGGALCDVCVTGSKHSRRRQPLEALETTAEGSSYTRQLFRGYAILGSSALI